MPGLRVEPPRSFLPGGRPHGLTARIAVPNWAFVAAWAASLALMAAARGDVLLLALILAAVVGDSGGLGVLLALLSAAVRTGGVSLAGLAGAHEVLGPLMLVGPPAGAVSTWLAAGAVVLATRTRAAAVPLGAGAAVIAAWPSGPTAAAFGVRIAAMVIGSVAAMVAARFVAPRSGVWAANTAGSLALGLAVLA